ncbi:MAG: glycosyltransferase family 4 protein [Thermoleophilia bacterium]
MRVAIVHGYFLGDSGSAIYTRELARELTRAGHEVTIVCQEQRPQAYDFIDSLYVYGDGNPRPEAVYEREPLYAGSCRLVRPHIGGRILTYVAGPFPPFEATPFQDAPDGWIREYVEVNIAAMTSILQHWPQDLVVANHAVMQPYVVRQALEGLSPQVVRPAREGRAPYVVTIHGSELNFTVSRDARMEPYMAAGLSGATAIAALSADSLAQVVGMAGSLGVDISGEAAVLPPGVDTRLFVPVTDRSAAMRAVSGSIDPAKDDIAVFAGRLMWTKGLQYAIAALPLILLRRPRFQLIVVGDGPQRQALERLAAAIETGDIGAARALVEREPELKAGAEYGPVIPLMDTESEMLYRRGASGLGARIHFTGHLPHERLAPIFGAADLSLAPSVFPEAFGLVSIEAVSAGALPIATYQTGLRAPLDMLAELLGEDGFRRLGPGCALTEALAGAVNAALSDYPTRAADFRQGLHRAAEENFSWGMVAKRYLAYAAG